jgi:hypothetical protein
VRVHKLFSERFQQRVIQKSAYCLLHCHKQPEDLVMILASSQ